MGDKCRRNAAVVTEQVVVHIAKAVDLTDIPALGSSRNNPVPFAMAQGHALAAVETEKTKSMDNQTESIVADSKSELIPVSDAFAQALDGLEYKYTRDEKIIRAKFPTGQSIIELVARSGQEYISTVDVLFNICCPTERRTQLLIFINEIKWEKIAGGIRMDPSDGEVRCRLGMLLDKGRCTKEQADIAIQALLGIGRAYAKYILKISFGNISAEEVLAELRAEEEENN